MNKQSYKFAPYIPMKEFRFRIPNLEFIGYDKDGKVKFKKNNKPKQQ